jgi:hypothetical protein
MLLWVDRLVAINAPSRQGAQMNVRRGRQWLVLGDSCSSGEGIADARDGAADHCQRSRIAYAYVAAAGVKTPLFSPVTFLACTGATVRPSSCIPPITGVPRSTLLKRGSLPVTSIWPYRTCRDRRLARAMHRSRRSCEIRTNSVRRHAEVCDRVPTSANPATDRAVPRKKPRAISCVHDWPATCRSSLAPERLP